MQRLRLETRIAIHQGHDPVAPEPDWVGPVESYWRDNDTLTFGDIRRMLDDLEAADASHEHRIGGGAAGGFTIRLAKDGDAAGGGVTTKISELGPFHVVDGAVVLTIHHEYEPSENVEITASEIRDADARTIGFVVTPDNPERAHRGDMTGEFIQTCWITAPEAHAEVERLRREVAAFEKLDGEGAASLAVDLTNRDEEVKRLRYEKERLEAVVKSLVHASSAALPIMEVFADDPAPDEVPDWEPMMRPVITIIERAIVYAKHVTSKPTLEDIRIGETPIREIEPASPTPTEDIRPRTAAETMLAALEEQKRWHDDYSDEGWAGSDLQDITLAAIAAGKEELQAETKPNPDSD